MKVLIAGGGPTGAVLAALLLEEGMEVALLEDRPEVLAQLHSELPTEMVLEGRATDLEMLESGGLRSADVLVACTSSDADNLVLCYLAQTIYGLTRTIGRINNPNHAWLFDQRLHVDVALNESAVLAHLIEEEMSLGDMMTLLKLRRGQFSLVEVVIPPGARAAGTVLKDMPLPDQCVIAGIIRRGKMVVPRGTTVFEVGDEVLAITDSEGEERLATLFAPPNSNNRTRNSEPHPG